MQVPLRVFFISLAILAPLVALLPGLVRQEGAWLASALMVRDVFGNWDGRLRDLVGQRHWLQDDSAKLLPLLPLTLFGLFVAAFLAYENDTLPTLVPPEHPPAGRRHRRSSAP